MKLGKYDIYGWLLVFEAVIGTIVIAILPNLSIPFLSIILGALAYSKVFKKKLDKKFLINVIVTQLLIMVIALVLVVVLGASALLLIGGGNIMSSIGGI